MVLRTYLSRLGIEANSGDTIFSDPAASPPSWVHLGRHAGGICGPSGSGKTVVQNFLHAEMRKAGAQQVFIDKDRGAEIFVRALVGVYLILNPGEPTGFAPFKALVDTPPMLPGRAYGHTLLYGVNAHSCPCNNFTSGAENPF
ncbi:hypothetical protein NKH86_30520 [Mesorhizobium sp. M0913]|uniref:hypothetical protein n=1 Tax=Mesorhizobium sp. M0913 TaxID=2957026 RepID=UPI003339543D